MAFGRKNANIIHYYENINYNCREMDTMHPLEWLKFMRLTTASGYKAVEKLAFPLSW